MNASAITADSFTDRMRDPTWWQGLLLVGALAAVAQLVAQAAWAEALGLSTLTVAIVLGIAVGNTVLPAMAAQTAPGIEFCKGTLLRVGIVLYGLRVTFQQIGEVGTAGLLTGVVMVAVTFALAVVLGTRLFRLDRETSMLIGAGASICGAAAVMATAPVVRAQAHRVSVAVATVVVFGTVGMFVYPLLYPLLGLSEHAYGVYAGSTIHEVAQVVVAGRAIGETAAATAVIEKMLRVMLLAPFLLLLSTGVRSEGGQRRITIPWFAVLFVAVAGLNSMQWLPSALVEKLVWLDGVLLAMAMAALGLRTQATAVRQAGMRPLLLAASLFVFLVVGGLGINLAIAAAL